jgi:uncharacterized protein YcbX
VTEALRVSGLWRYPVKSMAGEPLPVLAAGPAGGLGDRVLAVALVDSGRILTARQEPRLLAASARWLGGPVEISLPTGRTVRSDDPDADRLLSQWLGRAVALERPSDQARTVPRSPDDDSSTEWELPPGGFVDEGALHLLDERLLGVGRGWHPGGDWDVRRFRPNVVLSGPAGAPAVDGRLALGDAVLAVTGPCRRCVLITRPQPGLPADKEILRAVARRAANEFGAYATPVRAGDIRLGDPMVPAPDLVTEGAGGQ